MKIIKNKLLSESQFKQINQLWNDEFPIQLNDRFSVLLNDVENYNHYFIEDEFNNIIAWSVGLEKNNEKRFSLIVAKKHQGEGYGTFLLSHLKKELLDFFGWVINHNIYLKVNGEPYLSPLVFYLGHGFQILKEVKIDSELLKAVKIRWKVN